MGYAPYPKDTLAFLYPNAAWRAPAGWLADLKGTGMFLPIVAV